MRVTISTKNFNASEHLKATIEKKLSKLDKYFSDDIETKVMVVSEKGRNKLEATILAKGTIFRAEDTGHDIYESVDKVVDKLASQMSRFKTKLQNKHKGQKEFSFTDLPDLPDFDVKENKVVKTKRFELEPMNVDDAIMQMELSQHDFYLFLDVQTDKVNVVYRRKNDDYGLLETL